MKITPHSFFPDFQFSAYWLKKPLLHEIFLIVADLSLTLCALLVSMKWSFIFSNFQFHFSSCFHFFSLFQVSFIFHFLNFTRPKHENTYLVSSQERLMSWQALLSDLSQIRIQPVMYVHNKRWITRHSVGQFKCNNLFHLTINLL